MFKPKFKLSPIITFILLTIITILLSGILSFFDVQGEYSTVNLITNDLTNNVIQVESLFSFSGLKHIVVNAVSDFVNFAPLSMLIIVLIGIGILEKTGFLRTFFTLITKSAKKNTLTFLLILISIFFSIVGNIGFVIMLPMGALLFKYGRRNPLGGIIASFAAMSFGLGINILLSATDSSLLALTTNAAKLLDLNYSINLFFAILIMSVTAILMAIIFTRITEKVIMPKLGKYEFEEEEDLKITNKELRGLIVGLGAGLIYILLVIYMIIPGLPFSGGLLDKSGTHYIDMIFGDNSLFNKGFVFIVTLLFVIIGFFYGIVTKSIKNSKDVSESLSHSLDGIGSVLVLIFFASLFINVFKKTNIGTVITALLSSFIVNLNFTGVGLIIVFLIIVVISNLFCPGELLKWKIFSGITVPLFMNASISPEFTQIIFTLSNSISTGFTPLFVYFVIYIAFLEKYNKDEIITLFGSMKYMIPYGIATFIIVFVILVGWYITGIPLGVQSFPGVIYGA